MVKALVTWLLKPTTKLTIMMTVATPAITPKSARRLRSFWARMAPRAKATFAPGQVQASQAHSVLRASTTGRFEALRAGQ